MYPEGKNGGGELVLMLNELTDSVLFFQLVRLF